MLAAVFLKYGYALVFVAAAVEGDATLVTATFLAHRENHTVQWVLDRIARHGTMLVLFSRFVYGFRIAIPAACGATGMSPVKFTIGDIIGSIVWSVLVGLAGFAIGQLLDRLLDDLRRYEWPIAVVLFCGVVLALAWRGRDVLAWRTVRLRLRKDEA